MRDEDIRDGKEDSSDELDQYIRENPEDMSALIFSAWCEEQKRWNNKLNILNDEIVNSKEQILVLEDEFRNIGMWKNLYRKLLRKTNHKQAVGEKIFNQNEMLKDLTIQASDLASNPPKEWRYKLAFHRGDTIFEA